MKTSDEFKRPTKTSVLVGDSLKAKTSFGFDPEVRFKDLVKLMIDEDIKQQSKN